LKVFIAGVMQGSIQGKGIIEQDYRQTIRGAVLTGHPDAEVIDPISMHPHSVEYDDAQAEQVLFEMADLAAGADLIIAYLPTASMGSAGEMLRAYDNGKPIITISPMDRNWFILALSTMIFPTLEDFCTCVRDIDLEDLAITRTETKAC